MTGRVDQVEVREEDLPSDVSRPALHHDEEQFEAADKSADGASWSR